MLTRRTTSSWRNYNPFQPPRRKVRAVQAVTELRGDYLALPMQPTCTRTFLPLHDHTACLVLAYLTPQECLHVRAISRTWDGYVGKYATMWLANHASCRNLSYAEASGELKLAFANRQLLTDQAPSRWKIPVTFVIFTSLWLWSEYDCTNHPPPDAFGLPSDAAVHIGLRVGFALQLGIVAGLLFYCSRRAANRLTPERWVSEHGRLCAREYKTRELLHSLNRNSARSLFYDIAAPQPSPMGRADFEGQFSALDLPAELLTEMGFEHLQLFQAEALRTRLNPTDGVRDPEDRNNNALNC